MLPGRKPRENSRLQDREEKTLLHRTLKTGVNVLATAAVLGGGYMGYRQLKSSGALDDAARGIQRHLQSNTTSRLAKQATDVYDTGTGILKGINKTLDGQGIKRILKGKAGPQFKQNLNESLRTAASGRNRAIGGAPTFIERILNDYSSTTSRHALRVVESIRKEKMLEKVAEIGKKDKDVASFLEEVIKKEMGTKKSDRIYKNLKEKKDITKDVAALLDEHKIKGRLSAAQQQNAYGEFLGILEDNTIDSKFIRNNKDVIQDQMKNIEKQYIDSIVETTTKKRKFSGLVQKATGMDTYTLGDAVKDGLFETDLPLYTRTRHTPDAALGGIIDNIGVNPQSLMQKVLKQHPELAQAAVDPLVLRNAQGGATDLRFITQPFKGAVNSLADNFQLPFINIRPFQMMSEVFRTRQHEMPTSMTFRAGTMMDTIKGKAEELTQDYFYFNERLVNQQGEVVGKGYLVNAYRGLGQRGLAAMSGRSTKASALSAPEGPLQFITKNILDVGYQDYQSDLAKKGTFFTKFRDEHWLRNIWDNIGRKGTMLGSVSPEVTGEEAFKSIYEAVSHSARALDQDSVSVLADSLEGKLDPRTLESLRGSDRQKAVIDAINELVSREQTENSPLLFKNQFRGILEDYKHSPDDLLRPIKTVDEKAGMVTPDALQSVFPSTRTVFTKLDEAEKMLHAELINIAGRGGDEGIDAAGLIAKMKKSGASKSQLEAIENLEAFSDMQRMADGSYFPGKKVERKTLLQLSDTIKNKKGSYAAMDRIIRENTPLLGLGPVEKYNPVYKDSSHIFVRQSKKGSMAGIKEHLTAINEGLKTGNGLETAIHDSFEAFAETTYRQWGFGTAGMRAGRENMDKVTRTTQGFYYASYRLNELFSKFGLGLSSKNMGSTQDILLNLAARRIAAPLAIAGYAAYANDETGNVLGEKPTQTFGRMYANATVGLAAAKEATGLNALMGRAGHALPGIGKLRENPIGRSVQLATFGFLGETRDPGDLSQHYESGYEEVRKGRFWLLGSTTPWYGGSISYHQPSWYRRLQADPLNTEVLYGSTQEKWANSMLPNPRNPLGGLNPLTWGHWNRKHYDSRPYPVSTSGLERIPLVGPMMDATVGRIVKPFRKRWGLARAHEDYLEEINELTKYYAGQQAAIGHVQVSAGGRITPMVQNPVGTGTSGMGAPTAQVGTQAGSVEGVDPTGGFGPMQSGSYINQAALTAMNQESASYSQAVDRASLNSLRDSRFVEELHEAKDPGSVGFRLGQTYFNAMEMSGIYGFALLTQTGDLGNRGVVLESSNKMTSLQRQFWDAELGGLGGPISEVYRRFLQARKRRITEYNPIRNTMDTWLPGPEYFQSFRHGDPYSKIPKGELRLPGAGYESLNKLHPDVYGEYGAIDRFLILGDVAPYSQQYHYYSRVVSQMRKDGQIDDETQQRIQESKQRTRDSKEKIDFTPYKFKYADIEKESVTVTRWLDENTFLTKEYAGQPIKLAGIKMPGAEDESSEAEMARQTLHRVVQPGEKIKIGLDADPINRMRDESSGAMEAVVYDKMGDPLQAKLARMYGGSPIDKKRAVEADWEGTDATTARALFYDNTITVGKLWEKFTHMDTPIHTKLMQNRSPVEMYKRQEVYGKNWRTWYNPIDDWIKPTIESMAGKGPIRGGIGGAIAGSLMGVLVSSSRKGAIIGGAIGASAASMVTLGEVVKRTLHDSDYTWVPRRRRQQRDINEYFDMLKYVKYRGLYEDARQAAIRYEGFDPEELSMEAQRRGARTRYLKDQLKKTRAWLNIENRKDPNAIKGLHEQMGMEENKSFLATMGPMSMTALQYKLQYESTLYGADPYGDIMKIYRALPKKDRAYFTQFMKAPAEEREEILRLVPENQKRFYQAKWGMKVDSKPNLEAYFTTRHLPGKNWEGWQPDVSIEEVKLKFVHKEGLEIGEFDFWEDDLKYVKDAPRIPKIHKVAPLNAAKLDRIMRSAGVRDARVEISRTTTAHEPENTYNVMMNIKENRKKEITKIMNNNVLGLI